ALPTTAFLDTAKRLPISPVVRPSCHSFFKRLIFSSFQLMRARPSRLRSARQRTPRRDRRYPTHLRTAPVAEAGNLAGPQQACPHARGGIFFMSPSWARRG